MNEGRIVHSPTRTQAGAPAVGLDGFATLLAERGLIAASDLVALKSRAVRERIELAEAVVGTGVAEADSYAALAAAAGADLIQLSSIQCSELAVRLVPERL